MIFADVHNHSLYGCDDGAKTKEQMEAMLDASYNDGVRFLCFTPHYNPGFFGENIEKVNRAFIEAKEYISNKYPDMKIALGNELRYNPGCVSWINEGKCRRMNDTRYVLVDFDSSVQVSTINEAIDSLLRSGYIPIVAHIERYSVLYFNERLIDSYKRKGVIIQIDTRALNNDFGLRAGIMAKRLLKNGIVDIVSSDGHNLDSRPTEISLAYKYIEKKTGKEYAEKVCFENASRLIFNA